MATQFVLFVSYSQIAVFRSGLPNPFSDWTQEHVEQGFAYRDGSVSFRTILEGGSAEITIEVRDYSTALSPAVRRAIEVPYVVTEDGEVEVASISESVLLDLTPGSYALRFEDFTEPAAVKGSCKLTFMRSDSTKPSVLMGDDEVKVRDSYLMEARAA